MKFIELAQSDSQPRVQFLNMFKNIAFAYVSRYSEHVQKNEEWA